MVKLLHLLVLAWCLFECVSALPNVRGRVLKLIMFGALGLIHGLVPLLTPRHLMWGTSDESLIFAAFLALIGILAFSAGWRLVEAGKPDWEGLSPGLLAYFESRQGQRLLKWLFVSTMVASISGWLLAMIASAGSIEEALAAGRFEHRGSGNIYAKVILSHLVHLIAVPGFICFFLPRPFRWAGIAFAIIMAGMLFIASHGARAISMGVIGSLTIGYLLRYRVAPHRMVLIGAAGLAVIMLSIALYEVRKVMAKSSASEMVQMTLDPATYQDALARDPLNYHQFLVAAIEHFPRDHPYVNGATYIRLVTFMFPRKYFPELKPEDTHNTFAKAIRSYSTETTIPPTMMGDGYINFWGFPGVPIVMFVNGLLFGWASLRIRDSVLWFVAIGGPFARLALLMVRGSPYEVMVLCISATMFIFLLATIGGHRFRAVGARIRQINMMARNGTLPAQGQTPVPAQPQPSHPSPQGSP